MQSNAERVAPMNAYEVKLVFVVHAENEAEAFERAEEYLTDRHTSEGFEIAMIEEGVQHNDGGDA